MKNANWWLGLGFVIAWGLLVSMAISTLFSWKPPTICYCAAPKSEPPTRPEVPVEFLPPAETANARPTRLVSQICPEPPITGDYTTDMRLTRAWSRCLDQLEQALNKFGQE